MTDETCGHAGCTCKARDDGFCSDYCASHPEPEGDAAHECGCGHGACDHSATQAVAD
jgi:hypothetical protein